MAIRKTIKTVCAMGCAAALAAALPVSSASAQSMMCTKRVNLLKELNGKYQEYRQGLGITAANKGAMEFYVSETGTWTIIMSLTNGNSCIVAAGHSWQALPIVARGPDA